MVVTVLVYLPSIGAGFIWDDDALVTNNPAVKTADGLYSIWFTSWSGDYIPLTTSSFWLEWRLWKAHPAGYHIVNILLHAANAALLWRILTALRAAGAWLAALLFAVHPVCAASVTWVAERKNTLSMLLFLASLLFFLRHDEAVHPPGQREGDAERAPKPSGTRSRWFWLALGAFAAALFAKSSVAILPAVLLLCVWWRRKRLARLDFARTIPFFALSVLFSLIAIFIQHKALRAGVGRAADPLLARLIGGSWALWFYLGKILLPLKLTMIYQRWQINPANPLSYAPGVLFAAMIALFWRNRAGWGGPPLFGFGYFVIALGPVLGLFDIAYFSNAQVADHLQYLAIPGILALVAAGIMRMSRLATQRPEEAPPTGASLTKTRKGRQPSVLAAAAPALVAIVLSALTWQRERVLGDSEKLWRDNALKNQTSWRVYMNLNMALLERGKTNEAIQMFHKATALFPAKK